MPRVSRSAVEAVLRRAGISVIKLTPFHGDYVTGSSPGFDAEALIPFAAVGVDPDFRYDAVTVVHEAAHIIAATGRTARARVKSANRDSEDKGVLQIECRIWNHLGLSDAQVRRMLYRCSYGLEGWSEWMRHSAATRELVRRKLLKPGSEALNFPAIRRHVLQPTKGVPQKIQLER